MQRLSLELHDLNYISMQTLWVLLLKSEYVEFIIKCSSIRRLCPRKILLSRLSVFDIIRTSCISNTFLIYIIKCKSDNSLYPLESRGTRWNILPLQVSNFLVVNDLIFPHNCLNMIFFNLIISISSLLIWGVLLTWTSKLSLSVGDLVYLVTWYDLRSLLELIFS